MKVKEISTQDEAYMATAYQLYTKTIFKAQCYLLNDVILFLRNNITIVYFDHLEVKIYHFLKKINLIENNYTDLY